MFHVYSKRASKIVPKMYILSLQRLGYFFCFLRKKFILSLIFSLCPGLGLEWLERSGSFYFFPDETDIKKRNSFKDYGIYIIMFSERVIL